MSAATIDTARMTARAFRQQWREVGMVRRAVADLDDQDLVDVQTIVRRGRRRVTSVRPVSIADRGAENQPWE